MATTTPAADVRRELWSTVLTQLVILAVSTATSVAYRLGSNTPPRGFHHRKATICFAWTTEAIQLLLALSGIHSTARTMVAIVSLYLHGTYGTQAICYSVLLLMVSFSSHTLAICAVDWIDLAMSPKARTEYHKVRPFMLVRSFLRPRKVWVHEPAPLPPMPRLKSRAPALSPSEENRGRGRTREEDTRSCTTLLLASGPPHCGPLPRNASSANCKKAEAAMKHYASPTTSSRIKRRRTSRPSSKSSPASLLKVSMQNRLTGLRTMHGDAVYPTPNSIVAGEDCRSTGFALKEAESPVEGLVKRRARALEAKDKSTVVR